jgi:hypothetical protein
MRDIVSITFDTFDNADQKEDARMAKKIDLFFKFGEGADSPTCGFCGTEFDDHGVTATLMGGGIAGDVICGSCIGSGPKGLARIARIRAEAVREMRPEPDDDPDLYIEAARCMRTLAGLLDGLEDFTPIRGGIVAVKIAEGYMETPDRPRSPRKPKKEAA